MIIIGRHYNNLYEFIKCIFYVVNIYKIQQKKCLNVLNTKYYTNKLKSTIIRRTLIITN